eukprot:scaffold883_cov325-Pavlova_lutheri.AAC.8
MHPDVYPTSRGRTSTAEEMKGGEGGPRRGPEEDAWRMDARRVRDMDAHESCTSAGGVPGGTETKQRPSRHRQMEGVHRPSQRAVQPKEVRRSGRIPTTSVARSASGIRRERRTRGRGEAEPGRTAQAAKPTRRSRKDVPRGAATARGCRGSRPSQRWRPPGSHGPLLCTAGELERGGEGVSKITPGKEGILGRPTPGIRRDAGVAR